jgi:hypothetical protein
MRRLALALALMAGAAQAEVYQTDTVLEAYLVLPTQRYDHAVLGDSTEWGGLDLLIDPCALTCQGGPPNHILRVTLPEDRVFEDVAVRVADVDGEPGSEVVVVESDLKLGASLAVYGTKGKIAATDFIGQRNRWLAPAGIADFDGDGRVEIAYVDRPHLLAELVFVRLEGDRLVETLRLPGLTNHRIGEAVISGGVRDCGQGPELILASKDWTRLMQVRGDQVSDLGPMPPEGLSVPPC